MAGKDLRQFQALDGTHDKSLASIEYTVYLIFIDLGIMSYDPPTSFRIVGPSQPDIDELWRQFTQQPNSEMGKLMPDFIEWLRFNRGFVEIESVIQMQISK